MSTSDLFGLISGVLWTVTYVLVIRKGLRDRSYAMPMVAMVVNISWEFLFTFVYPSVGGATQEAINVVWLLLDVGIVFTYVKYWRSDYSAHLSPKLVWVRFAGVFLLAIPLLIATVSQFGEIAGSGYTAFGDNLLMSALFITMLRRRGNRRGQSLAIAWAKLLGTVTASISQYLYDPTNAVWNVLYVEILALDLLYVVMLTRAQPYHGDGA